MFSKMAASTTPTLRSSYRNTMISFDAKPKAGDLNKMNKTVNQFLEKWSQPSCNQQLRNYFKSVAFSFASRFIYETFQEADKENLSKIFYAQFEFTLAALKFAWYVQNADNRAIIASITDNGFMTNQVYHILEQRYFELEQSVNDAKLLCQNQYSDLHWMALVQSAVYHCLKHPVEDVHELQIKQDQVLVKPVP